MGDMFNCAGIYNMYNIVMYVFSVLCNTQKDHVLRVKFICGNCRKQSRLWSSPRIFSGHYLVNQKYVLEGNNCCLSNCLLGMRSVG